MTRPRLVLASTSPYRAQLLARLEIEFETASPRFDEETARDRYDPTDPAAFALELAAAKAKSLRADFPDAIILGADQIAVLDGQLLTKPGTAERAITQLLSLAGKTHALITGVVLSMPNARQLHEVDRQEMTMRDFGRAAAQAYVERHAPLDCVGSYRIEDAGISLFSRSLGQDYTGIIGLPLMAVGRLLREAGLLAD